MCSAPHNVIQQDYGSGEDIVSNTNEQGLGEWAHSSQHCNIEEERGFLEK